ncbi:MAG TPA: nucleotidyltransferase domain-containing protein [Bryobacteraceae bacterium]|nr:nucleotidyltransferase domain-containing protein [Bryobacteraceae bacterium]
MADILNQLVERLRTSLGAELVSVVLYGSAATGDRHEKFSDYNVLCILTKITPAQLRSTEPVFRWWHEQGNPSPLLLTEHELRASTDCFPIEFHDIREHHRILYGIDLASGLAIDTVYYRAQVEHELRAKLLRLRQKASGILSDKDVLRRMLVDSVSTFCVLLRHVLILKGAGAPGRKREVIAQARETFGIDTAVFETLLDLREEKPGAKLDDPEGLLGRYMTEIDRTIDLVDEMGTREEMSQ